MKKLLKLWVKIKCWIGKKFGWIKLVHTERTFVQFKFPDKVPTAYDLKVCGVNYKPDRLLWIIPFDWQFDSVTTWKRGGGDCNSLNRIIQVALVNRDIQAWLVTYIAKPFSMSHGTVLTFENGKWYSYDYGNKSQPHNTQESALQEVASKYNSEVRCYVMQDVTWQIC